MIKPYPVNDSPAATLGEGPIWVASERRLYWVDVVGKQVFRVDPASGRFEVRQIPFAPSGLYERADRGFLLVTKKGLALFEFESGTIESIAVPEIDFSNELFNDGVCDRNGRLWIGTRDINAKEPRGSLYCISQDFKITRHRSGIVLSNGIAISPDGRKMYHVESIPGRVDVYDFSADAGEISDPSVFLDCDKFSGGHPDGCAVDAEGGLWIAMAGGGRIARFLSDGSLDQEIETPVSKPTSVAFGGEDLRTLYVTSMRLGLSDGALAREPFAGRLLSFDVGVRGSRKCKFAGSWPSRRASIT